MNFKKFIPFAAFFLFHMSACKKTGGANSNPKTSPDVDIYMSGFSTNGGAYWKNGIPISLPGSFGDSNASVAVSGKDVYVVGYSLSNGTNGQYIATIWKNGTASKLDEGSAYSEIENIRVGNIVVNGNDVYTVGYENGPGTGSGADLNVAMYWKNNILVKLTDGSTNAFAYAIAVNENDIYVAGSISGNAVYWKNGNPVNLTNTNHTNPGAIAVANSIAINGTDIYVAGNSVGASGNTVATYWKNGIAVNLTDGSTNASITAITINNNNAFAAGFVNNSASRSVATYWKNGVPTVLGDGTFYTESTGIAINGTDVYVTEQCLKSGYWKNNVFVHLPDCYGTSNIVVVSK